MKKTSGMKRMTEVMAKLDKTFKPKLNEMFEPDYSSGEYFIDSLKEIVQTMKDQGFEAQSIIDVVNKVYGIKDEF